MILFSCHYECCFRLANIFISLRTRLGGFAGDIVCRIFDYIHLLWPHKNNEIPFFMFGKKSGVNAMMSLQQMLFGWKLKFPLCSRGFCTRRGWMLFLPMLMLRIECKLEFNDLTTTQGEANIRFYSRLHSHLRIPSSPASRSQTEQFRLKKFCFSTLKANLNNFSSFPGERLCDVEKSELRLARDKASATFQKSRMQFNFLWRRKTA